jgi:Fur family ferric uptake transcriptional regulator
MLAPKEFRGFFIYILYLYTHMKTSEKLLSKHSLRKTLARQMILEYFSIREGAQALSDLEKSLGGMADRATLYRTLKTFEDVGIVHKVVDPQGVVRYALCGLSCEETGNHTHTHVHFSCNQCSALVCLDEVFLPTLVLPEGFLAVEVQMVYSGICKKCSKQG